jgi:hypothetical protein
MQVSRWWRMLCLVIVATSWISGCTFAGTTGNPDLPETRVLFIGNSFTSYNLGIDQILHGLAPRTAVELDAPGGFTLQDHLASLATLGKVREGNWTYVVIQEQSQVPVIAYDQYVASVRKLVAEVRAVGAIPLLLATWARPDDPRISSTSMSSAVRSAGKEVKAAVIPAGLAFAASLASHDGIVLTQNDGHPTPEGTYLAGCVVYAQIFGKSPEGNTFLGGVDAGVAQVLQATAGKTARSN